MRLFLSVFAFAALIVQALPSRAAETIVDKPLGAYFLFAGLNTRIDGIQTVAKKDGNPVLKDVNTQDDDKGYVIVRLSMQNPSASTNRGVPGNNVGFELQDGTQMDEGAPGAQYIGQSLAPMPDQLHPKQTVAVTYVMTNWNGSPITKMFMHRNSGYSENDAGTQYARFAIPANYVQTVTPAPMPQPTDEAGDR